VEKAVVVGITKYFDIRSGDIPEARVKEMISSAIATAISQNMEDLMKRFDNKLDSLGSAFGGASGNIGEKMEGSQWQQWHISIASTWRNTEYIA
jgi:hypothetical protein